MRTAIAIVCLLVPAAACNEKDAARSAQPVRDAVAERAAAFAATSPPPAQACSADQDCGVFPVAPGDDPCCDVTVTALPMNVHYLQANAEWRRTSCAGVVCPPNALPGALPASCAFEARCDRGTCANTCDQIPPPTPRSAMPAGTPGRTACKVDDDCVVMGLAPSAVNPCCDGAAVPAPISRAYLQAVQMWRPLGCKDVRCPPPDTSSVEPTGCAMAARCVRGACADRCPR
jgi:hypothetical protein